MRTIIIILCLNLGLVSQVCAQRDYQQFYQQHKGSEGVLSFAVPAGLLRLILEEEAEKDLETLFDKVDQVSLFAASEGVETVLKGLKKSLPEKDYKDLVEIKDGASVIRFKAKEVGDGLEEVLMTVEDEDSLFVLCFTGSFTYTDARKLVSSIQMDDVKRMAK